MDEDLKSLLLVLRDIVKTSPDQEAAKARCLERIRVFDADQDEKDQITRKCMEFIRTAFRNARIRAANKALKELLEKLNDLDKVAATLALAMALSDLEGKNVSPENYKSHKMRQTGDGMAFEFRVCDETLEMFESVLKQVAEKLESQKPNSEELN